MLQIVQDVQSLRDSRAADVPSTAHRADGQIVPRNKLVGSKRQRELGPDDLELAIRSKGSIAQTNRRLREAGLLPAKLPESKPSAALRASDCVAVGSLKGIKSRKQKRAQADIST